MILTQKKLLELKNIDLEQVSLSSDILEATSLDTYLTD